MKSAVRRAPLMTTLETLAIRLGALEQEYARLAAAIAALRETSAGPSPRTGTRLRAASERGPALYAETTSGDAIIASSLDAHGVHALGGGVTGGLSFVSRPCGVFAEGGSGDGVYATGEEVAVRGMSASGYGASFAGGTAPLYLAPATTVGAPTTKAHQQGTLFVDADTTLWLCIADGVPGTWKRVVVQ
jgi:hypothetical protein